MFLLDYQIMVFCHPNKMDKLEATACKRNLRVTPLVPFSEGFFILCQSALEHGVRCQQSHSVSLLETNFYLSEDSDLYPVENKWDGRQK